MSPDELPRKTEQTAVTNLRDLERAHADERRLVEAIRTMHEDELVDFIRDTVVRLDALADRLEVFTVETAVENSR